MKKVLLTTALVTILLSCENQDVNDALINVELPNEKAIASANTGIENAPHQSGFIVTREDANLIFVMVDFEKNITITVGVDNYDFCNPFPNFDAFKTVPSQQVDIPNDPLRVQIVQKGVAYFEVIQGAILPNEFICDFIQNNELIASGYARTTFY